MLVGEAVQRLMEACLKAGYVTVKDRGKCVDSYLPSAYETAVVTLPKIADQKLIQESEKVLEKANEAAEEAIG